MNAVSPPEAGYAEETQIKSIFGILIVVALIAEHLHEDLHEDRYRLCGRSHGTASLPCEAPNMQRGSLAGAPVARQNLDAYAAGRRVAYANPYRESVRRAPLTGFPACS